MPKEIATKTKEETYYKCIHCGGEIFWNTHKKLTHCNCKWSCLIVAETLRN